MPEQITEATLETILQTVDRLHDAAHAGRLLGVSPMSWQEIQGWLEDIVFTAEETLRELRPLTAWHPPFQD